MLFSNRPCSNPIYPNASASKLSKRTPKTLRKKTPGSGSSTGGSGKSTASKVHATRSSTGACRRTEYTEDSVFRFEEEEVDDVPLVQLEDRPRAKEEEKDVDVITEERKDKDATEENNVEQDGYKTDPEETDGKEDFTSYVVLAYCLLPT